LTSFKDLGLSQPILDSIEEMGFENPTKIQAEAIPHLLEGYRDFIGLAQTGTGKTAAFGLPLLELVEPSVSAVQALILAPTRELGQQIAGQLSLYSKHMPHIDVMAVYGGAPIVKQIKALKRTQHIVIATPGRLIDLVKRKAIKLNDVAYLVLDEADEMLNMGFKDELDEILRHTPDEKITWLFSATMPKEIKKMVDRYMVAPIEVKVDQQDKVNVNIDHQYVMVRASDKMEALTRFIDIEPNMRSVVFCRTKMDTQNLAEELIKRRYHADAIHGDLSQAQRDKVMNKFKANDLQLLIATDVAARGIDVNDLTHVFHYTLPDDVSWYTHRSGRTARAGKKGTSIAFLQNRDLSRMEWFSRQLDVKFNKVQIPKSEEVAFTRMDAWAKEVLNKKIKTIDPELLEKMEVLFGKLSKEELLAKVIKTELDKLQQGTDLDLNKGEHGSKGDGRGRGRGGRGRGGSRGGRGRSRDGRGGGGRGGSRDRDRDGRGGGGRRRDDRKSGGGKSRGGSDSYGSKSKKSQSDKPGNFKKKKKKK